MPDGTPINNGLSASPGFDAELDLELRKRALDIVRNIPRVQTNIKGHPTELPVNVSIGPNPDYEVEPDQTPLGFMDAIAAAREQHKLQVAEQAKADAVRTNGQIMADEYLARLERGDIAPPVGGSDPKHPFTSEQVEAFRRIQQTQGQPPAPPLPPIPRVGDLPYLSFGNRPLTPQPPVQGTTLPPVRSNFGPFDLTNDVAPNATQAAGDVLAEGPNLTPIQQYPALNEADLRRFRMLEGRTGLATPPAEGDARVGLPPLTGSPLNADPRLYQNANPTPDQPAFQLPPSFDPAGNPIARPGYFTEDPKFFRDPRRVQAFEPNAIDPAIGGTTTFGMPRYNEQLSAEENRMRVVQGWRGGYDPTGAYVEKQFEGLNPSPPEILSEDSMRAALSGKRFGMVDPLDVIKAIQDQGVPGLPVSETEDYKLSESLKDLSALVHIARDEFDGMLQQADTEQGIDPKQVVLAGMQLMDVQNRQREMYQRLNRAPDPTVGQHFDAALMATVRGTSQMLSSGLKGIAIADAWASETLKRNLDPSESRFTTEQQILNEANALELQRIDVAKANNVTLDEVPVTARQKQLEDAVTTIGLRATENPLYKWGQSVQDYVYNKLTTDFGDERIDNGFWAKLGQGFGSSLGFLSVGLATGGQGLLANLMVALSGAAVSAAGMYDDAKASGATEAEALDAAGWSSLTGASEVLPISRLLGHAGNRGLRNFIKSMLIQGAEEGIQEFGQTVGDNAIAKAYFDPNRGYLDGAVEAAGIGATVGMIMDMGMSSINNVNRMATAKDRYQKRLTQRYMRNAEAAERFLREARVEWAIKDSLFGGAAAQDRADDIVEAARIAGRTPDSLQRLFEGAEGYQDGDFVVNPKNLLAGQNADAKVVDKPKSTGQKLLGILLDRGNVSFGRQAAGDYTFFDAMKQKARKEASVWQYLGHRQDLLLQRVRLIDEVAAITNVKPNQSDWTDDERQLIERNTAELAELAGSQQRAERMLIANGVFAPDDPELIDPNRVVQSWHNRPLGRRADWEAHNQMSDLLTSAQQDQRDLENQPVYDATLEEDAAIGADAGTPNPYGTKADRVAQWQVMQMLEQYGRDEDLQGDEQGNRPLVPQLDPEKLPDHVTGLVDRGGKGWQLKPDVDPDKIILIPNPVQGGMDALTLREALTEINQLGQRIAGSINAGDEIDDEDSAFYNFYTEAMNIAGVIEHDVKPSETDAAKELDADPDPLEESAATFNRDLDNTFGQLLKVFDNVSNAQTDDELSQYREQATSLLSQMGDLLKSAGESDVADRVNFSDEYDIANAVMSELFPESQPEDQPSDAVTDEEKALDAEEVARREEIEKLQFGLTEVRQAWQKTSRNKDMPDAQDLYVLARSRFRRLAGFDAIEPVDIDLMREAGFSESDIFDDILKPYPEYAEKYRQSAESDAETGFDTTDAYVRAGDIDTKLRDLLSEYGNLLSRLDEDGDKITNKQLADAAAKVYGGADQYQADQMYDAFETAVNLYVRRKGFRVNSIESLKDTLDELHKIEYGLQGRSRRTDRQIAAQQFSTPPRYAAVVAGLAGIRSTDTVLEPSAGNGSLVAFAKNEGARVVANEFDADRANNLRVLGADEVLGEDASIIDGIEGVQGDNQPTIVIMNPPFSNDVTSGGKKSLAVGREHLQAALNALQPGGRLVAIVGRGMGPDSKVNAEWWSQVSADNDVRVNIPINGDVYTKYGTSFGTRLIVIDKVAPTSRESVIEPNTEDQNGGYNLKDALDRLQGIMGDRGSAEAELGTTKRQGDQGAGSDAGPGTDITGATDAGTDREASGETEPGSAADGSAADRGTDSGTSSDSVKPDASDAGSTEAVSEGEQPGPRPDVSEPPVADGTGGRTDRAGDESGGVAVESADDDVSDVMSEQDLADLFSEGLTGGITETESAPEPTSEKAEKPKKPKKKTGGRSTTKSTTKSESAESNDVKKTDAPAPTPKSADTSLADDMLDAFGSPLTFGKPLRGNGPQLQRQAKRAAEQGNPVGEQQQAPTTGLDPKQAAVISRTMAKFVMQDRVKDFRKVMDGIYEMVATQAGDQRAFHVLSAMSPHIRNAWENARIKAPALKLDPAQDHIGILKAIRELSRILEGGIYALHDTHEGIKQRYPKAKAHPGELVESVSMASVIPPLASYQDSIPADVISSGAVSMAQLEAVVQAGAAHNRVMPNARRFGYFVGDGTGVGKARTALAMAMDNIRQGRRKVLFVSANWKLAKQLERDWEAMNGKQHTNGVGVISYKSLPAVKGKGRSMENVGDGIMFVTYDTLASKAKKDKSGNMPNVDAIEKWLGDDFDGLIVFDESHLMKNAPIEGNKKPSQRAIAGTRFQKNNRNARITYMSATGATEVTNLAYAERLGLWGPGTQFTNASEFVNSVNALGLNAMEQVATDLKRMGAYQSRSISFRGVSQKQLGHELTEDQTKMVDSAAEIWSEVLQGMNQAVKETGGGRKQLGKHRGIFFSGMVNFYNSFYSSLALPTVIDHARNQMEEGKSVVFQIMQTNEANAMRALDEAETDEDLDKDEALIDLSPARILTTFLDEHFPTQKYKKNLVTGKMEPVFDSNRKPVVDPRAVARKEALKKRVAELSLPPGLLDALITEFGQDNIAEVTGRKSRQELDDDGNPVRRERKPDSASLVDMKAFQDGKKRALVFSKAGATGFDMHASNDFKNQQQRIHYLLQPGWSAIEAVQGLGRTHRTNQASAPEYYLVTVDDLPASQRFISSVARRLQELGALTKGERRGAGNDIFGKKPNLESAIGRQAINETLNAIANGQVEPFEIRQFAEELGLEANWFSGNDGRYRESPLKDIGDAKQFLTRSLILNTDAQLRLYAAIDEIYEDIVEQKKASGTLDTGVQEIVGEQIQVQQRFVINRHEVGEGATADTEYVQLAVKERNITYPLDDIVRTAAGVLEEDHLVKFHQNKISKKVYVTREAKVRGSRGERLMFRFNEQGTAKRVSVDEFMREHDEIGLEAAKTAWKIQREKIPPFRQHTVHMITGAVLPVWNNMVTGDASSYKIESRTAVTSDTNERLLGRVISDKIIEDVLANFTDPATGQAFSVEGLNKQGQRMSAEQYLSELLDSSAKLTLNGGSGAKRLTLKRNYFGGGSRLELMNTLATHEEKLKAVGLKSEIISGKKRWYLPIDEGTPDMMRRLFEYFTPLKLIGSGSDRYIGSPAVSNRGLTPAEREVLGAPIRKRERIPGTHGSSNKPSTHDAVPSMSTADTPTPSELVRDQLEAYAESEDTIATKKTVSREQVRKAIENWFNVRVSRGGHPKLSNKALGLFFTREELIRLKNVDDLVTMIHEFGHLVDKRYFKHLFTTKTSTLPGPVTGELDAMGRRLYGNTVPAGGYIAEGFAEYMIYKVLTGEAHIHAPNTDKYFNKWLQTDARAQREKMPKYFRMLQEIGQRFISQGQLQRTASHIESVFDTDQERSAIRKFMENVLKIPFEAYTPLRTLQREIRAQGVELAPKDDPYWIARVLTRKTASRLKFAVEHEVRGLIGDESSALGPGLVQALQTYIQPKGSLRITLGNVAALASGQASDKTQFRRKWRNLGLYLVLRHAKTLQALDIETGIGDQIDPQLKALEDAEGPKLKEAADAVTTWVRNIFKAYGVGGGLIDPADARKLMKKYPYYVPLFRAFDPQEFPEIAGMKTSRGTSFAENAALGGGLFKLKGSARRIKDPLMNIIEYANMMIESASKQQVMLSLQRLHDMNQGGAFGKTIEGLSTWISEVKPGQVQHLFKVSEVAKDLENAGIVLNEDVDTTVALSVWRQGDNFAGALRHQVVRVKQPLSKQPSFRDFGELTRKFDQLGLKYEFRFDGKPDSDNIYLIQWEGLEPGPNGEQRAAFYGIRQSDHRVMNRDSEAFKKFANSVSYYLQPGEASRYIEDARDRIFGASAYRYFEIKPALRELLTGLDPTGTTSLILKPFAAASRVLRAGATLYNVPFGFITNPQRDILTRAFQSRMDTFGKVGTHAVPLPWSMASNMMSSFVGIMQMVEHTVRGDTLKSRSDFGKAMAQWLSIGNEIGSGPFGMAGDKKSLRNVGKWLQQRARYDRFSVPLTPWQMASAMLEIVQTINSIPEMGVRVKEFQQALKQGEAYYGDPMSAMLYASLASQEATVDFLNYPKWLQIVNKVSAFSGAQMQAVFQFIRTFSNLSDENDGDIRKAGVVIANRMLQAIAFSTLMWFLVQDDDRVKGMDERLSNDFMYIPIGKIMDMIAPGKFYDDNGAPLIWRYPNNTLWGYVTNAVPTMALDQYFNQNKTAEKTRAKREMTKHLLEMLGGTIPLGDIAPTLYEGGPDVANKTIGSFFGAVSLLRPLAEVMSNIDTFTRQPIVPFDQQQRSMTPNRRKSTTSPITTAFSRGMAKMFPSLETSAFLDPIQIEHVLNGYTANMPRKLLDTYQYFADKFDMTPWGTLPTRRLKPDWSDTPIIGRSFLPSSRVQRAYRQEFEAARSEVDLLQNEINKGDLADIRYTSGADGRRFLKYVQSVSGGNGEQVTDDYLADRGLTADLYRKFMTPGYKPATDMEAALMEFWVRGEIKNNARAYDAINELKNYYQNAANGRLTDKQKKELGEWLLNAKATKLNNADAQKMMTDSIARAERMLGDDPISLQDQAFYNDLTNRMLKAASEMRKTAEIGTLAHDLEILAR